MNREMYLRVDGVRGGSRSTRHPGSIEIAAFTWGDDRLRAGLGGGGFGKAQVSALTVTKPEDISTPVLRLASSSGQHFRNAALIVEEFARTGCLVKTLVWKMTDVLIDSVTSSGHSRAGQQVMEAVKLNFANYRIERG